MTKSNNKLNKKSNNNNSNNNSNIDNNGNKNSFYFFALTYLLALFGLFIVFKPFFYSLILGVVLGVFFFPLNKYLINKGLKPVVSSLLLVFFIFILIILSSVFFVNSMVKEVSSTYAAVSTYDFSDADNFLYSTFRLNISTENVVMSSLADFSKSFSTSVINIIGSVTDIIIGLFIMLFLLFYIFKDGENIMKSVMNILPVSDMHKYEMRTESKKILFSVMYGQFLIALVQGLLGGFAFLIFGLNNPVFWGFIMAVLSFIPMLGTPAVWIPAALIQLFDGNIFVGIGLLVYGSLIMFPIENIVRPRIIGRQSGMHPLVVLLSIFGGLKLFGIIGLLIGPILVALCVLIIKFFNQELLIHNKNREKNNSK